MSEMTTLERPDTAAWRQRARPARPRRRPAKAPAPRVADTIAVLAGLGLGASVGLAFWGESFKALTAAGGWLTLGGRLTGLTGTYLMLVLVVLVVRFPWLERTVGQVRLVQWHRRVGAWPIVLITLHVILITVGYAQTSGVGVVSQFWTFLRHYPDMLSATVGFVLMLVAGVTSLPVVRRRMKYQTWWAVHLYLYLAIALAFAHEIATGVMFISNRSTRELWIAMSLATLVAVLGFRVVLPVWRNLRWQARVVSVDEEAPGVYSMVVSGRNLSRLEVSGGQFFQWRFLARGLWWHSHPYSLSALPRPPFMRVTIKRLGIQSEGATRVKPGTRVILEGPYGTFTSHARATQRVVLIGAGVGITPIRALLEDLPGSTHVTVIVRASSYEDIVHRSEIAELVKKRNGVLFEVVGPRERVRLDSATLRKLLGNLSNADVYVCGPSGFSNHVIRAISNLGARPERIHQETFTF